MSDKLVELQNEGFVDNFDRVQRKMYANSAGKGFHDIDHAIAGLTSDYGVPAELVQSIKEARIAQRLMLVVSELSEALEAVRNGNPPDSHIPEFSGLEAESADAVIRLMDLNETEAARLGKAIVAKAAYNANRQHKHGGKKF
jgi:hypothetical protein